ncbi:3-hydroxybutyryl-CoA dehydratase [Tindallia magadiensis]|uniref:3-hydroxybutyryl-CoA dehydratase n=1 Tax=Tindallia magadiensis TaxID=69895 RepID=A0A1I3H188_9FIRM|nr:MaoC family dehydratase [Tindallia magadiensis]SFI29459.1 3-hydroxybutyryl-CoA dehydratase [Tindallia magadiensis]
MQGKTIEEISLGDRAYFEKTITETDVYLFAGISGDTNPAHMSCVAAEKSQFKERIAHGLVSVSLISCVLGVHLPGPGTIYLGQEIRFTRPVKFGDTVRAEAEVIDIIPKKNRVVLKTTWTNQEGQVVIEGTATVMPPKASTATTASTATATTA